MRAEPFSSSPVGSAVLTEFLAGALTDASVYGEELHRPAHVAGLRHLPSLSPTEAFAHWVPFRSLAQRRLLRHEPCLGQNYERIHVLTVGSVTGSRGELQGLRVQQVG